MPVREILWRIGNEFLAATGEEIAEHTLARFISNGAPGQLKEAVGIGTADLMFVGSAGKGNWATVPWLAAFEKSITDSATRGYYIVYLFNVQARTVALSLNQGMTAVQEEFGNRYREILRERAALMRERLVSFAAHLPATTIDLGSQTTLARGYAAGHALGRVYEIDSLPPEEELIADMVLGLKAYRTLRFRGGIEPSEATDGGGENGGTVTERRQYGTHRRLERAGGVAAKVKKIQGYQCRGCDIDYGDRYADFGRACIEAHHLFPIHKIKEDSQVEYDLATDFAVLCANCHRLIHRLPDSSDIAELRSIVCEEAESA